MNMIIAFEYVQYLSRRQLRVVVVESRRDRKANVIRIEVLQ